VEITAEVAALVERVRSDGVPGGGRDVRWVRLDGLHLTLRFIGPTLDGRVDAAAAAVRAAAAATEPFEVSIGGAGTFPPAGRPRALWLGVRDGEAELAGLARKVDDELTAAGWAFETKPFRAHLTLARSDGVPAGSAIGARLVAAAATLDLRFRAERMGLFESLTGGGPARYEPIEMAALG
jgi:2'-5' RNA ligase